MGYFADSHVNARYERLAGLARSLSGHTCDAGKVFLLEVRLKPVMDLLGVGSIDELLERVGPDVPSNLESYFADALVDGETWFFRERKLLDALAERAVARLEASDRPVAIWCAGASSGQEAYSLAILLDEKVPGLSPDALRIVASDIGYRCTARAEAATYSHFEIQKGLSARRMVSYFSRITERDWQASSRLRSLVDVRQHNLLDDAVTPAAFDFVLCRNVLTGMGEPHRAKAVASLRAGLKPDGRLLLAASEVPGEGSGLVDDDTLGLGFFRLG